MSAAKEFHVGDRVRISPACPIDFEAAGPLPGDSGEIVSTPGSGDARACFAVRLRRMPSPWLIPRQYLEPAGARRRPVDERA
jgi:hypothetical protein